MLLPGTQPRTQSNTQGRCQLPESIPRHKTQAEAEESSFEASQRLAKRSRTTTVVGLAARVLAAQGLEAQETDLAV